MGAPVMHFEFWTQDIAKTGEFYGKVFDWSVQDMPFDYSLIEASQEKGINGGMLTPKEGEWPAKLTFYIEVDDLDTYLKRIADAGGTVLVEKQEVEGVGVFALFADPEGRVLGMWQGTGD